MKKITAGVDTKSNPELILHEQMMALFTMIQEQTEADDDYLNRFNLRHNMEMSGGEHFFVMQPQANGEKI